MNKLELDVIDVGTNGKGVAKLQGLVYFVPFVNKGEKIVAKKLKIEKNYCECELVKVISPSKDRAKPVCKYFGSCGGCQLQHMNRESQLNFKTNEVYQTLAKNLGKNLNVLPCVGLNEYGYRNKVNFTIKNNKLCFAGINKQFLEIDNCPLFVEDLSNIIKCVNKFLSESEHNFIAVHFRCLKEVYQITFVSEQKKCVNMDLLINLLQELKINFSLNVSFNSLKNSSNITTETFCVFGKKELENCTFGITYNVLPSSFLQVNETIQNEIYNDINSAISSSNKVINAYGGAGVLSAMIAKKAGTVYSIEINKQASENCKKMIEKNKLKNIISICGDCKVEIPKIIDKNKISHIIFDPPRNGLNALILKEVLKCEIENIIYLSCNIATLARDLKLLMEKYEIVKIQPYDMFPQTCHVETLVIFKKIK